MPRFWSSSKGKSGLSDVTTAVSPQRESLALAVWWVLQVFLAVLPCENVIASEEVIAFPSLINSGASFILEKLRFVIGVISSYGLRSFSNCLKF